MPKKKLQEELQEIEEKFAIMPKLAEYFVNIERLLRYYNCYEWEEGVTKEAVIVKRDALLETLARLNAYDLKILYYIRHLEGWRGGKFYRLLRELYQKQCNLLNELHQTDEFQDPVGIVFRKKGKTSKKR